MASLRSATRLAVLFETVDRGLGGEFDSDPPDDRAATAPLPAWLDRDRGRSVTLTTVDDPEGAFAETVDSFRAVHGFGPAPVDLPLSGTVARLPDVRLA